MADEKVESKLKLIHLLWVILITGGAILFSVGAMANQQKVNTERVDQKVEKEVFENHQIEQRRTFDQINSKLDIIIEKMLKVKTIGSKSEVWHGNAKHTSGGLTTGDLTKNKSGKIVSKKKQAAGRRAFKNNKLQPKTKDELAKLRKK